MYVYLTLGLNCVSAQIQVFLVLSPCFTTKVPPLVKLLAWAGQQSPIVCYQTLSSHSTSQSVNIMCVVPLGGHIS